ncbi:hypothetical protein GOP47_0020612 [Adiantum capillus-veneris]|uniref:SHSP domain-containing protein n=1 Tax=Adiantum capillus-veneris TaxID=13818 RepID=A0A9D4UAA5_ADICA|nr:hypothetical protein GOP47_0020612 [Adiantum capillus-veneris]
MALLVKRLSFLPFLVSRAPGSGVESYIAARTFATRRSANRAPDVVLSAEDDTTTTDEDEDIQDNVEVQFDNAVQAVDDTTDVYVVPCRVSLPTQRRAWATAQDENAVRFRMDMPGIAKENVKVYVDDGKLVVRGRYADKRIIAELEENVDEEASVLADNVGVYSAELFLPENVQVDKIKSQMKDGMLLVTAPKNVVNIAVE